MFISRIALMVAAGALLTGCASSPGDDLGPFGASVRHAMASQTYREGDPIRPMAGEQAVKAMKAYRGPSETPPIVLDATAMGME
ncbi:hypothetical protein [Marinobacter sp. SS21]|uniref:hypothetical protein n=1 Tax=Marinobacter sp. SS21 TaxID=2979460 RepID=UPI00232B798D|nr:hypothetical protein [Marinobacter sp. SS21]MDC0663754.1 hypothetical protein [Marinobacter sp. SS21]